MRLFLLGALAGCVVALVLMPAAASAPVLTTAQVSSCLGTFRWSPAWVTRLSGEYAFSYADLAPGQSGQYTGAPVNRIEISADRVAWPCTALDHEAHHAYDDLSGNWGRWDEGLPRLADVASYSNVREIGALPVAQAVLRDSDDPQHWNHVLIQRLGWHYELLPAAYRKRWFGYALTERSVTPLTLRGGW